MDNIFDSFDSISITEKEIVQWVNVIKKLTGNKFTHPGDIDRIWIKDGYMYGTNLELNVRINGFDKSFVDCFDLYNANLLKLAKNNSYSPGIMAGVKYEIDVEKTFPELEFPELVENTFELKPIKSDLEIVMKASAIEDSRYVFNGVFFDGGSITATDGRRLNTIKVDTLFSRAIVPTNQLKTILKQDVTSFYFTDKYAVFKGPRIEIAVKLIEGQFPHIEQVIPKRFDNKYRGKIDRLREVCRIAQKAGIKPSCQMILDGKDVRINVGDDKYVIEKDVFVEAPDLTMALNSGYVLDTLPGKGDGDAVIHCNTSSSPIQIEFPIDKVIKIVMPMKM